MDLIDFDHTKRPKYYGIIPFSQAIYQRYAEYLPVHVRDWFNLPRVVDKTDKSWVVHCIMVSGCKFPMRKKRDCHAMKIASVLGVLIDVTKSIDLVTYDMYTVAEPGANARYLAIGCNRLPRAGWPLRYSYDFDPDCFVVMMRQ